MSTQVTGILLGAVARALLGTPTKVNGTVLCFDDIEVNLDSGRVYDYDTETTVDLLDLVRRVKGLANGDAEKWLAGFDAKAPGPPPPPLPSDLEAERELLGLILVKPAVLASAEEEIGATDFISPVHGQLFTVFIDARENDYQSDLKTILAAIGGDPNREVFPGFTPSRYLAHLIAAAPFGEDADWMARELARRLRENAEIERGDLQPEPPPRESRFGLIMWADQDQTTVEYEYLVEDLIPKGEPVLIIGESQSGKSYWTRDLAMAGARGIHFFGHRVLEPFGVVYCAYEAGKGFNNRQKAYRRHHGLQLTDLPFALLTRPADLWSDAVNVDQMIEEILWIEREKFHGVRIGAVVIDTHNAATSGASEIDSKEVSTIRDRYKKIMTATGASVWIIGHKNADGKHRGNQQLYNNIETAIDISVRTQSMDGKTQVPLKDRAGHTIRHAKIVKQREGEAPRPICDFVLPAIEIGTNRYGKPRTACVTTDPQVDPVNETAGAAPARGRGLTAHELVILQALRDAQSEHGQKPPAELKLPKSITTVVDKTHWRAEYLKKTFEAEAKGNTVDKRLARARDEFLKRRLIGFLNPWVWIIPPRRAYGDQPTSLPFDQLVPPRSEDIEDMDDNPLPLK